MSTAVALNEPAPADTAPKLPSSEGAMLALLRERYDAREWAFVPGLRNGTGYSRATTRTADLVVMNLWPSRGMALHGFEIKVSRSDWTREMRDPAKAEGIAKYCDFWWLAVASDKIVQPGELPDGWGLLVAMERAGKVTLRAAIEPRRLDAKPLDRSMIAAVVRNLSEGTIARASVESEMAGAFERGRAVGEKTRDFKSDRAKHEADDLRERIRVFEAKSGVSIDHWNAGPVAEAVKAVMEMRAAGSVTRELASRRDVYQRVAQKLAEAIDVVDRGVA